MALWLRNQHQTFFPSAVAFKSWWQWSQIKLRTVSIPLVELKWHIPLSFPSVTLIWILSGEGQNRSSINHFKSLVRVGGIHTALTMKRRLQFYIHSLLTNLLGTRTYMWLSIFFFLHTGCKYKTWEFVEELHIISWEKHHPNSMLGEGTVKTT